VARAHGPEEFFEALRSAKRDDEAAAAAAGSASAEEPVAETPQSTPTPPPASDTAPPPSPTKSVFAKDDPTITMRRSTLIFAAIVVAILLFIAFALGKSAGTPASTTRRTAPQELPVPIMLDTAGRETQEANTRRPTLPEHLRGKSVICLKRFYHTQDAGPANARAFRTFLKTSPDAAFVKSSGRQVFILEYKRELQLCVGPFDGGVGTPAATGLLQKLRQLRYNNVRQFDCADVRPVQHYAKVFN